MSAERVARAAAKGGDWVGEIMTAVGMRQGVGGVGIGDGGMGTGRGTDARPPSSAASSARSKERDALRLGRVRARRGSRVRAVERSGAANVARKGGSSVRRRRRQRDDQGCPRRAPRLFGDGILSERRFRNASGGDALLAHVVRRGRHAAHRARRRGGRDGGEAAHDPAVGDRGGGCRRPARGTTTRQTTSTPCSTWRSRDSSTRRAKPVKRDDVSRFRVNPRRL